MENIVGKSVVISEAIDEPVLETQHPPQEKDITIQTISSAERSKNASKEKLDKNKVEIKAL